MLSSLNRGVTPAIVPSGVNLVWPIPAGPRVVRTSGGRAFGATRGDSTSKDSSGSKVTTAGTQYHAGVDLFGKLGDLIVAPQDCEIVNFYHFYRGTYSLIIKTNEQVINIGEVHKDSLHNLGLQSPIVRLKPGRTYEYKISSRVPNEVSKILGPGSIVKAGEQLAIVGKMFRSSMLHFEIYSSGTDSNKRWYRSSAAPSELRDPTPYLLALKAADTVSNTNNTNALAQVEAGSKNPRSAICKNV